MKRVILLAPLVVVMASAGTVLGQGISGTDHDFSGQGWSGGQICIPCHAPHNVSAELGAPLWNHDLTTQTFTMYSFVGDRPEGDLPRNQDPGIALAGPSKLCLSCHDGLTALDSYGGATGTSFMPGTPGDPGSPDLGIDLTDDHPIAIQYPDAAVNSGYHDPSTFTVDGVQLVTVALEERVECSSCHNPHDSQYGYFLRQSNAGSALCLECHNK